MADRNGLNEQSQYPGKESGSYRPQQGPGKQAGQQSGSRQIEEEEETTSEQM